MKFLHLGDLHIGKTLCDFDLCEDQEYILNQIIDIAKDRNVDAVLIAGDVYDKAIPSEAAVRLFDEFLNNLVKEKFKVCMISGNHDSDERLNFGSSLFKINNLYISAKCDETIYKKTFEDDYGKVNVYLLPFVKHYQVRRLFPQKEINNYEDAVRVLIENSNIDASERNIIVAHQFVTNKSEMPQLSGSEGVGTKNVGTIEMISAGIFDEFDYVALGHIHSCQSVGKETVRYSGSPLKYSLSEVNADKYVPIVELNAKGDVKVEKVLLKPLREVRHIKGTIEKLLDKNNIKSPDDYIYVTLTNEDYISDAMGIFQQYYPNTLHIDYDNSRTKDIQEVNVSDITQGYSFEDMVSMFYREIYGCDISSEEMELMQEVAREAGCLDETN